MRFATAEGTQRQRALACAAGPFNVDTPPMRLNGVDGRAGAALPALQPSAPRLTWARAGDAARVGVAPLARGDRRLAGRWARLADGPTSRVRAGAIAGETLRHIHVVRPYWGVAD